MTVTFELFSVNHRSGNFVLSIGMLTIVNDILCSSLIKIFQSQKFIELHVREGAIYEQVKLIFFKQKPYSVKNFKYRISTLCEVKTCLFSIQKETV
jgi:hypothetical protein